MPVNLSNSRGAAYRRLGVAALLLAATAACSVYGFTRMMTSVPPYDDEGSMLIGVKYFNDGHALYDEVYSRYGPFSFLMKRAICYLLKWPIDHDLGRMICLTYWLATAAACAGAVYRMTWSVAAAVVGLLAVFMHLAFPMSKEPGHPQEIGVLLLGIGILLSTWATSPRRLGLVAVGLGLVGGCLAMTKINLGVFYAMALGMTLLALGPRNATTRVLTALYVACLLAAPSVFMRPFLDTLWCRQLDVLVTLSLVAALILSQMSPRPVLFSPWHWASVAGAFLLAVAVNIGTIAALGSSVGYALYANSLLALKLGTTFTLPATGRSLGWLVPPSAVAVAVALVVTTRRVTPAIIAVIRVAVGLLLIYFTWNWRYDNVYLLGPPFACFLLAPATSREWSSADVLARTFLAFLTVTEVLWTYPVSGTQQLCATFLCLVAGVVNLHDGAVDLAALDWLGQAPARTLSGLAWSVLVAGLLLNNSLLAYRGLKYYSRDSTPLGLPGSRLIRLQPEQVTKLRAVSENLRDGCDTFLSFPGLNSYYFWARKEPPTGFNMGNWMYLLDDRQLADIQESLAKFSRPCIVINRKVLDFWMQGKPVDSSIATYVNENYQYKTTVYGNELWVKKDPRSGLAVNSQPGLVGESTSEQRVAFPEMVRPSQKHAQPMPSADQ
jgi:hypothetical protein